MKTILGFAQYGSTFLLVAVLASGCSKTSFQAKQLADVSQGALQSVPGVPQCQTQTSDYELDEQLIDFEITSSTNISFGFNLSGILNLFGLNTQVKKGQMMMSMHLYDTVDPVGSLADVLGTASSTDASFGFNLNIIKLGADFSYYSSTPIGTLSANTIKNGLGNLQAKLKSIQRPWSSRIVQVVSPGRQFIIPAGSIAGLRVGDQLAVYNINYVWEGTPCQSVLLFQAKTPESPIAYAKVSQLEENAALLDITQNVTQDLFVVGSQVFIQSLPLASGEKGPRQLLHSVHMGPVKSPPIAVADGTVVDFTKYLQQDTLTFLTNYGLYPRNAP